MATSEESLPAEVDARKTEPAPKGRSWRDPGIRETLRREREQKTMLAKAFLDRMGCDDDLDMHHSCLERAGG